jgi:hypothetical protein
MSARDRSLSDLDILKLVSGQIEEFDNQNKDD